MKGEKKSCWKKDASSSFQAVFTIPRKNSATQTSPMVGAAAKTQWSD